MVKLAIGIGFQDIPFGSSDDLVLENFGPPIDEQLLNDIATHPRSRRLLRYSDYDVLVTPEFGLISVTVTSDSSINFQGIWINSFTPGEFLELLRTEGCTSVLTEPNGWGEQDVESLESGVIASFCDGRLEIIEIFLASVLAKNSSIQTDSDLR